MITSLSKMFSSLIHVNITGNAQLQCTILSSRKLVIVSVIGDDGNLSRLLGPSTNRW